MQFIHKCNVTADPLAEGFFFLRLNWSFQQKWNNHTAANLSNATAAYQGPTRAAAINLFQKQSHANIHLHNN